YYVGQLTFLEAILRAGGTDTDHYEGIVRGRGSAQNRHCYILRKGVSDPIIADYAAIQMGKQPDIALQPGDIVYVPERSLAYVSRITAQVLEEIVTPLQKVLDASDLSQKYYRRDWQLPTRGKARTR
ncbi:MAG: hypothetical protein N3A66_07880, partial [Planctomycetota bacterium]|nr:hypothetical protein [Planctomycetota bacterium]